MAIILNREYRLGRYRIVALSWLTYGGFYLCRKNFSVTRPLLNQDVGFTKDHFAMVLFFYSLFYAMGQFYNGFLSDKFGPRLIVGICLFLSVLANTFMGFGTALLVFGVCCASTKPGNRQAGPGPSRTCPPGFGVKNGVSLCPGGRPVTLMGIELVKDRQTKEPATEEADRLMYSTLSRGLSFKVTMGNIITLTPPLTITKKEMDRP